MDIGSLFLILALALAVGLFIAQPFLNSALKADSGRKIAFEARDHVRSALLAEREQVLDALQELDFDQALGKIPAEDFPFQRSRLLAQGAAVLRKLDELEPPDAAVSAEDRLEAAVAARRAETRGATASATIGRGMQSRIRSLCADARVKKNRQAFAPNAAVRCNNPTGSALSAEPPCKGV